MRSFAIPVILLSFAAPVSAAVFTVTKTADTLDGFCDPYDCSLREAVAAANQTTGTDVVELPPGTYVLTRTGAGEDSGATGDLDVDDPLILAGRDAATTILDGNAADRVLDIRAEAEVFGVTVRNGQVSGPGGGVYARRAILDYRLVVRRSVISGNRALGLNGIGGGVMSETGGGLDVLESTVSDNRADAKGGGLAADRWMSVADSTVSGNSAGQLGGGLYYPLQWYAWVAGSTITRNQAGQDGGGIYAEPPGSVANVESQLQSSIVAGNTAPVHPDCSRGISRGYNVIGTNEGCVVSPLDRYGSLAGPLDPRLGTLANQGGTTPVHEVLPGSPAVDLVPVSSCLPSDQIGQVRGAPCEAGAVDRPLQAACVGGGPVLCLRNGRFRVTADWSSPNGSGGPATAAPLTDDTGNYWFFSPDNLELTVKVVDGCALNDRFWVFSSGLTDRGVGLRVEDLATGSAWTHTHPAGTTYAPRLDTSALDVCDAPGSPVIPDAPGTLAIDPVSAVLVVTKGADTLDGDCDYDCSLREAVAASNDRPGVEVILLGARTHTLSRAGLGEDRNATGDLDVKGSLAILGSGAPRTVIDGGALDRILEATELQSRLEIHGVTLRNGDARFDGHTDYGSGGAIHASNLTLVASHVTDNRSAADGGGVNGFLLFARDTTVSDNQARDGGGIASLGFLELSNVTVSGNQAQGYAGGLYFTHHELTGVTVTGNSAGVAAGGVLVAYPDCPSGGSFCIPDVAVRLSVVAGNQAPDYRDCYSSGLEPEHPGFSVFGVGTGEGSGCAGAADLAGTPASPLDPKLTPLGDHGGPTPTHALLADSPAIDRGPPAGFLPVDQRGRTRPAGPGSDAGAVERLSACQPDATTLCLGAGDRFRITARWAARGDEGDGYSIPLATDTGSFWFFDPANVELTLKVLDACAVNDRFWVFVSGLTDVRVDITVEDTATGRTWTHRNNAGTPFQPRLDTGALDICPEG